MTMTERATLGVAVIGTGKMGADHVRRIHEVVSGARVSAVVDVDAPSVHDGANPSSPITRDDLRLAIAVDVAEAIQVLRRGRLQQQHTVAPGIHHRSKRALPRFDARDVVVTIAIEIRHPSEDPVGTG